MPREFKCKTCGEEDSSKFPKGKKSICKKCKNEKQNKENQEKKELLEKIKTEESKPETPSTLTSVREIDPTFRQDIINLLTSQSQNFESKIQSLESQIQTLMSQIQILESRPIIINQLPSPKSSSSSNSSVSSPEASPSPSPVKALPLIRLKTPSPTRSKSPIKENPKKTEYKEMIQKINEDLSLFRKNKRPQNYTLKELEALCKAHKINRHGARNWDEVALAIISDLQNRINVC